MSNFPKQSSLSTSPLINTFLFQNFLVECILQYVYIVPSFNITLRINHTNPSSEMIQVTINYCYGTYLPLWIEQILYNLFTFVEVDLSVRPRSVFIEAEFQGEYHTSRVDKHLYQPDAFFWPCLVQCFRCLTFWQEWPWQPRVKRSVIDWIDVYREQVIGLYFHCIQSYFHLKGV